MNATMGGGIFVSIRARSFRTRYLFGLFIGAIWIGAG